VRRACVDIGSNTMRLLVAEPDGAGRLRPVHEERAFTRIGAAFDDDEMIPAAKCAEVIAVATEHLAIAREHGAESVRGVATAAIRQARNGAALVAELHAHTGLRVVILSDREEARLAFRGAMGMLEGPAPDPLGVLDVGGGSSEVVIGRAPGKILWWASLALGSGSLAASHLTADPPGPAALAAARAEVDARLSAIAWEGPAPARTLAVGGSATSLSRLAGPRLDPVGLAGAVTVLGAAPAREIAARFGIDETRARLLPAGLIILEGLARRLGGPVEVGRGGIREGVLLEALAR
jgi:exopolyphosphatase/guanosine-5'-triphosphate,3'-diphosphate pyrophosphatase